MQGSAIHDPISINKTTLLKFNLTALVLSAACFPAVLSADDKPLVEWTFEQGDDGCQPLHDVELAAKDGVLHVVSTGNDPHFIGPARGGESGWKKLVIRARIPGRLDAQIFWTTEAEPNTSEGSSVRFKMMPRGKEWPWSTTIPRSALRSFLPRWGMTDE